LSTFRPWAGEALRAHTCQAFTSTMFPVLQEPLPLDEFDWSKLRFQIQRWNGSTAPPVTLTEGGRNDLFATHDPAPGLYLLSLTIPRKTGEPLQAPMWMPISPWRLAFYSPGVVDVNDPAKAAEVFKTPPLEQRDATSLCLLHRGRLGQGFGPAGAVDGFLLSAETDLLLPPGKYILHIAAESGFRLLADGRLALDHWQKPDTDGVSLTFDASPKHLQVQTLATYVVQLLVEPAGELPPGWADEIREAHRLFKTEIAKLNADIAANPTNSDYFTDRAQFLGRAGRLREASADFARAIALAPDNHWNWYLQACVLAYLDDAAAYRQLCSAMLPRFADATEGEICDRIAKSALLLPERPADIRLLNNLMARAQTIGNPANQHWFKLGRGLLEYRNGRYAEAIDVLDQGLSTGLTSNLVSALTAELLKTMSRFQLGQVNEARAELPKILERIDHDLAQPGVDDIGNGGLENCLICQILRREAESLIPDKPTTRPAAKQLAGTQPAGH